MLFGLASYLSDKLEYVCCFRNVVYVSFVFYDVDDDTFSALLFNCVFCYIILLLIMNA